MVTLVREEQIFLFPLPPMGCIGLPNFGFPSLTPGDTLVCPTLVYPLSRLGILWSTQLWFPPPPSISASHIFLYLQQAIGYSLFFCNLFT